MLLAAGAATAGETSAGEAPAAVPTVALARTVTLITGDRVRLSTVPGGRTVASLEPVPGKAAGSASDGAASGPAAGNQSRRVRTMTVADRLYVVPDTAMPYVGRQLDLALFDVTEPAQDVEIAWAPGATPHALPGLTAGSWTGAVTRARVSRPATFGAALSAPTGDATATSAGVATPAGGRALAGVRSIRPVGTANADDPPTANPAYPQATLIVRGVDALGAPALSGGVSASNADDVLRFGSMRSFVEGEVAFSVPVGTYSLSIDITTFTADRAYVSDALLVLPQVRVTAPQTVVTADARTAAARVPVPRTPQPADSQQIQLTYGRTADSGGISTTTYMLIGGVAAGAGDPDRTGDRRRRALVHLLPPGLAGRRGGAVRLRPAPALRRGGAGQLPDRGERGLAGPRRRGLPRRGPEPRDQRPARLVRALGIDAVPGRPARRPRRCAAPSTSPHCPTWAGSAWSTGSPSRATGSCSAR